MNVNIRFGFLTSDFDIFRKGYDHICSFPPIIFQSPSPDATDIVLYHRGWRPLLQWRGKEWRRQREIDFVKRHGMTYEEAMMPENRHLFVAKTRIVQAA